MNEERTELTSEFGHGASKRLRLVGNSDVVVGREQSVKMGVLRTKPSRGDCPPTHSMSCSDKIALWNICGLQGGLLSNFIDPVYIDHFIIGGNYNDLSAKRALSGRNSAISIPSLICKYRNNSSKFSIHPSVENLFVDTDTQLLLPDECSYFWFLSSRIEFKKVLTIVNGCRKGSRRPKPNELTFPKALQCPLSRSNIFENCYQKLLKLFPFKNQECGSNISYEEAKLAAKNYQLVKSSLLKSKLFSSWIQSNESMKLSRNTL